MSQDKLTIGKGSIVTVSFHNIQSFEYIRNIYPNMDRGQRIENDVVIHH